MTAKGRLLDRPVTGSSAGPVSASLQPLHAECADLSALDSAPRWAREFTRRFLARCHDITTETADDAVLLVSELVTNAYQATGVPSGAVYSQRVGAPVIRLSLRHFPAVLLIEVIDSSPKMPHPADPGTDAENGHGLVLTGELSAEWGYFPVPQYGKCVYCILRVGAIRETPACASDNVRRRPAPEQK